MEIASFFLDLLFPIECLGCGKDEIFLCKTCASGIARLEALCVFCGVRSEAGKPCLACAKTHALDRVFVAADYDDEIIRRAVHALKYEGVKGLAQPLGKLLIPLLTKERLEPALSLSKGEVNSIVIPLPLHPKRLKTRGYNQAELLAREVAQGLGIPLRIDILARTRDTHQQVGLTGDERRANLKNAFSLASVPLLSKERLEPVLSLPKDEVNFLKNKTILLIDDVTTTGTTLNEAAKVLKQAGAKQVWGLVVARG